MYEYISEEESFSKQNYLYGLIYICSFYIILCNCLYFINKLVYKDTNTISSSLNENRETESEDIEQGNNYVLLCLLMGLTITIYSMLVMFL